VRVRRFHVVVVACIAAVAFAGGWVWRGSRVPREILQGPAVVEDVSLEQLQSRYGPHRFSQGPEEWIVRDYFKDRRGGVFVDVGASYPFAFSNTAALEQALGWSGVAIDALEELAPEYASRTRTRFLVGFVGASDSGTSTIFVDPDRPAVSSLDRSFTRRFTSHPGPRQVRNRTLDSLLDEAGITHIDYLSMDIELGEPAALGGFTIARFAPRLACIEAQGSTRQAVIDYFVRHGYTIVGRYLRVDRANLYFAPLE
jgi:FkbM family methyltransferase